MGDKKGTILLVDDSSVIHKIVNDLLKDEDYNILSAYDGKEGLKAVEESSVDIILSDVNMPIMNGFNMCRELKSGKYKSIPLIFLTSEQSEENIKEGHKIGANDYLAKPFNKLELLFRVKNQLRLMNFQNQVKHDEKRHQHMAMIATLGHELNNSLVVLGAALDGLKREKKYNEMHIEKITKSQIHIADVVKKLRNLDPSSLSYEEYAEGVDMLSID